MLTVGIFSDHGGYDLKEQIIKSTPVPLIDFGTFSNESVDYPHFSKMAADQLKENKIDRAILICGTGIGIAMAANRYDYVRAFVCHTADEARLARQHNNANAICFAGRFQTVPVVLNLLDIFLATPFEGGRHLNRINQFSINT
ncbi:MAG: Ribose-5-phosphate isomerase B [Holosporales bacterium]